MQGLYLCRFISDRHHLCWRCSSALRGSRIRTSKNQDE